jgi:hypothetical protein
MTNRNNEEFDKIDVYNLSERDRDFLTLNTRDVMMLYEVDKETVYERRKVLAQTITKAKRAVGDEVATGIHASIHQAVPSPDSTAVGAGHKPHSVGPEVRRESDLPKPNSDAQIELDFGLFSVKLNKAPKKISIHSSSGSVVIEF